MTVWKDTRVLAKAAAQRGDRSCSRAQTLKTTGTVPNGKAKEPAYIIPPVALTKANWRKLYTSGFLKKSDICNGVVQEVLLVAPVTQRSGRPARGAPTVLGTRTVVADETPVLELRGISKSFGSVQALTDVDLEVHRGEVMALVGDNGAGKSTLIKYDRRHPRRDSGEILFEGEPVHISGPKDAAHARDRGRLPGSRALRQPRRRPEHVPRPRGARRAPAAQGAGDGAARRRETLKTLARDDDPLDPAAGRDALRRPAPVGRGRARRDVELEARHPRRADRGARRRADRAGARARQAARASRGSPSC